jgi:periplasmic protein TonB
MIIRMLSVFAILIFNFFPSQLLAQSKQDTTDKHAFSEPVESEAKFPGGQQALTTFIQSNIHYIKGAEGKRVIVYFAIEKDGSLTDLRVARGINEQADEEALRILKLSPKWLPDIQNGRPHRVGYTLPITFPSN